MGEHSNRISSDLVGHIAVSGNAVSTHNRCLNLSLPHEVPGHVVSDQSDGNTVLCKLPGGQARAL